ncbi:MAG TPA: sialate O-acetylesterase [Planctomycetia bacterium]|nr:sialate O-acetylesterase [Planctomycetia bacterium]
MRFSTLAAAIVLAGLGGAVRADVKPNPLFSDHMVLQRDAKVAVWGTAADGEKVTVSLGQSAADTIAKDGRWKVEIGPFPAGGPHVLAIKGNNEVAIKDVLIGEVWICSGQSNMEWPLKLTDKGSEVAKSANHPQLRLFDVPNTVAQTPAESVKARWTECNPKSVIEFSAVGYYFGLKLQTELGVPVGMIHSSWGGTPAESWTSTEALAAVPRLKEEILDAFERKLKNFPQIKANAEKAAAEFDKHKGDPAFKGKRRPNVPQAAWDAWSPASLYNGMLAPLVPYGIKGAIWYQGESNAGRADQYLTLFPAMISDWRARFGQGDFPFLCVQLAPFLAGDARDPMEKSTWAELRESQRLTCKKLPHVGMAVITDAGEARDIHPKNKKTVGERLAAIALVDTYGRSGPGRGPEYKSHEASGSKVTVRFDHLGTGLSVHDGPAVKGFYVCGSDRKFYPATAMVEGETVVVSSDQVPMPTHVRYGWNDNPSLNLFNKEGFPATPFKSDDFPWITAPKLIRKVAGR